MPGSSSPRKVLAYLKSWPRNLCPGDPLVFRSHRGRTGWVEEGPVRGGLAIFLGPWNVRKREVVPSMYIEDSMDLSLN